MANGSPSGRRPRGVVQGLVEAIAAARIDLLRSRRNSDGRAAASTIAASAVAYGATTVFSPSPRFRPSPGTPKFEYW